MKENLIIPPTMLGVITTRKCTAACTNCCFGCSPKETERLGLKEILKYIKQSTETYPSIKTLILTGGECFTLGKELDLIIKYSHKRDLIVRVVTNAYWAKSFKKAYQVLLRLQSLGLSELNISTGDEHQEWVPYDNIVNAIIAAYYLKMLIVVNIEGSDSKIFDQKELEDDIRLRKLDLKNNPLIHLINGAWINFSQTDEELDTLKEEENTMNRSIYLSKQRCTSLFSALTIKPDHNIIACCGITSTRNKYLFLGNANKYSLKYLYETQFDDFVKIWLFTEGPLDLLEFCSRHRNEPLINTKGWHLCKICAEVFNNDENIEILRKYYKEVLPSIIFKFTILRTKYLKALNYLNYEN